MAEPLATPFVMHGARDAIAGGLVHVEEQVKSIEQAVIEHPGLAFDLAKTLVESVCRAVLGERNIAFNEDDDLPKLFKTASQHLPFLPPTASGESGVRDSLKRTLGGLSAAIAGICELRNQCGFASHGAGSSRPTMELAQALLAAEAADTIVGFLHRVHRNDRTKSPSPPAVYDDNPEFNESVDEAHGVIRIYEVEFRASEVLFHLEPESYRVYLAEFDAAADGEVVEGEAPGNGPTEPAS
ncbi:MAG: abortive infection family protein [Planctomycetes bacterium]|nr:abortive infection family protein [Planctomycetota bacterium]MBI3845985.1 abortive infection family protein [Planctomycetota bacterium]